MIKAAMIALFLATAAIPAQAVGLSSCWWLVQRANGALNGKLQQAVQDVKAGSVEEAELKSALATLIQQGMFPKAILRRWPRVEEFLRTPLKLEWVEGSLAGAHDSLSKELTLRVSDQAQIFELFFHELTHQQQPTVGRVYTMGQVSKEAWVKEGIEFEVEAFTNQIEATAHLRTTGFEIPSVLTDMWQARKRYVYTEAPTGLGNEIPGFNKQKLTDVSTLDLTALLKDHILRGHTVYYGEGASSPLQLVRSGDYYARIAGQYRSQ